MNFKSLSPTIKFFFFAFLSLTMAFSSCSTSEPEEEELTTMEEEEEEMGDHTFMSLNLNGNQYNGLTIVGYGVLNPANYILKHENSGKQYIWLQGSHPSFEINIKIPDSKWAVGTYPLEEGTLLGGDDCMINYISDFTFDYDIEGSLEITEIDFENHIFKGNFNFSSPTNSATGGTLDYPLVDEEF